MSYRDWDLGALKAVWERRARAVQAAIRGIDVTGMTRPPRDPDERRFLEQPGRPGPFVETDAPPAYPRDCSFQKGTVSTASIEELAQHIARDFRPERIILFGSYARGEPGPDSDVDLLVILPFAGKPWRTATAIRARTRPGFPLDLIVRTPEQLRERLRLGDPFLTEIVDCGEVLYETDHG